MPDVLALQLGTEYACATRLTYHGPDVDAFPLALRRCARIEYIKCNRAMMNTKRCITRVTSPGSCPPYTRNGPVNLEGCPDGLKSLNIDGC
jgi:hypothetical protein